MYVGGLASDDKGLAGRKAAEWALVPVAGRGDGGRCGYRVSQSGRSHHNTTRDGDNRKERETLPSGQHGGPGIAT